MFYDNIPMWKSSFIFINRSMKQNNDIVLIELAFFTGKVKNRKWQNMFT